MYSRRGACGALPLWLAFLLPSGLRGGTFFLWRAQGLDIAAPDHRSMDLLHCISAKSPLHISEPEADRASDFQMRNAFVCRPVLDGPLADLQIGTEIVGGEQSACLV